MAPFAVDPIHDTAAVEDRSLIVDFCNARIRAVTLHTLATYLFIEIDEVGGIAWTVDPAVERHIIGDGKLEQAVAVPVEIALSLAARPDHDGEGLAFRSVAVEKRCLEEMAVLFFHEDLQVVVVYKSIFIAFEGAFYKCRRGRAGVEV